MVSAEENDNLPIEVAGPIWVFSQDIQILACVLAGAVKLLHTFPHNYGVFTQHSIDHQHALAATVSNLEYIASRFQLFLDPLYQITWYHPNSISVHQLAAWRFVIIITTVVNLI